MKKWHYLIPIYGFILMVIKPYEPKGIDDFPFIMLFFFAQLYAILLLVSFIPLL